MRPKLPDTRIGSIDAFRGLTIFAMIFVNELAGVQGIPGWMKHASADEDAMTFVDVVFPAFLFIVGMSIPFAVQRRLNRIHPTTPLRNNSTTFLHTLWRAAALIIMGVFMVNAESGYSEQAMGISIHLWSLLFYAGVILVWVDWKFRGKYTRYLLQSAGAVLLLVLAVLYRRDDGGMITPQWWGILGLIGWAYFISFLIYGAARGRQIYVLLAVVIGFAYYLLGHFAFQGNPFFQNVLFSQGGHAVHVSIVLAGVWLSLSCFHFDLLATAPGRLKSAMLMLLLMLVIGVSLRPLFGISKIYATPSWAAFSIAACIALFSLIHWLVEQRKLSAWTRPLEPAAANPLLVYIIPFIVYALMKALDISFPGFLYQGVVGIVWALAYAAIVIWIGSLLSRLGLVIRI
jgi:heparan-alpha-glucosaminide N-acetyltransferase